MRQLAIETDFIGMTTKVRDVATGQLLTDITRLDISIHPEGFALITTTHLNGDIRTGLVSPLAAAIDLSAVFDGREH